MITKLIAADLATAAGITTIICRGSNPRNVLPIINFLNNTDLSHSSPSSSGVPLHTRFIAKKNPMVDRKWWILHGLHTAGIIYIDEGAVQAISKVGQKSSLFAAGIVKVEGNFVAHQAVELVFEKAKEVNDTNNGNGVEVVSVGKGLVNYSSMEISRIKGCKSSDIEKILGYADSECVIHRDNLAVTLKEF